MVFIDARPNPADFDGSTIVTCRGMKGYRDMVFPMRYSDFMAGIFKVEDGAFVQDAFPMLSADYREFLISGITPEEWEKMFGGGDE